MKISLNDFRAFASTGPLDIRPLTFLVGENSSGKTSLLAAINYIWQLEKRLNDSSFNSPPFNLGTFDEIVHRVRGRTKPSKFCIEVGDNIDVNLGQIGRRSINRGLLADHKLKYTGWASLRLIFLNRIGGAFINEVEFNIEDYRLEVNTGKNFRIKIKERDKVIFDTKNHPDEIELGYFTESTSLRLLDIQFLLRRMNIGSSRQFTEPYSLGSAQGLALVSKALENLIEKFPQHIFASAPVRSSPIRVYTPNDQIRTPDGAHAPQALFKIKESNENRWLHIKGRLERFGELSGMFNAINVTKYRSSGSSPFQINVTRKGKQSSLVDVGYGVSQALPLLTDLIESPDQSGFLFQQPEVHLHPQAQAALGSFLVEYLSKSRKSTIVAETHSDHLIDRVRICVRKKEISPKDVSILYFDTVGTSTTVHQLNLDEEGNLINAPDGYRSFFIKEQMDVLGISD